MYLTPETSHVLFERAKWFGLTQKGEPVRFPLTLRLLNEAGNGKRDAVRVQACNIRAILFEFPPDESAASSGEEPLTSGVFTADVWFTDPSVTLAQLMSLNEECRYWAEPWLGHRAEKRDPLLCADREWGRAWASTSDGAEQQDRRHLMDDYLLNALKFMLEAPLVYGKNRKALIPQSWFQDAERYLESGLATTDPRRPHDLQSGWIVSTDKRAYVWSCAVSANGGSKDLVNRDGVPAEKVWQSQLWLHYLNVDSPSWSTWGEPAPVSAFDSHWAKDRTYTRWLSEGSAYGFSQHSGVAYVPDSAYLPFWEHWADSYFDQTLLLIYVRTTTFRFSRFLSALTASTRTSPPRDWELLLPKFEKLRWWFAQFTNLYQFPLLSSQQQGIEMYEKTREGLDIDELFKEIRDEIETTDNYLSNKVNIRQQQLSQTLNVVAVVGIAASLAMQLATSDVRTYFDAWPHLGVPLVLAIALVAAAIVWWRFDALAPDARRKVRRVAIIVFVSICVVVSLLVSWLLYSLGWTFYVDPLVMSFVWVFTLSLIALGALLLVADPLGFFGGKVIGFPRFLSEPGSIKRLLSQIKKDFKGHMK